MIEKHATHLVIGEGMDMEMRPFAAMINDSLPQFTLIYSNLNSSSTWKVSIYEFNP